MNTNAEKLLPPIRAEIECKQLDASGIGEIVRPLGLAERLVDITWLRRGLLLIALAIVWELYGRHVDNDLIMPTFSETARSLWDSLVYGNLLTKIWTSLKTLLLGYTVGVSIAGVLTVLAVSTRVGTDLLSLFTAMFNPLPAIALLPLALLWFGLGEGSIIFVLVHAVAWPMALNTHSGFLAVSDTLRMAGNNYGLRGIRFVRGILIPAALPSIVSGLRIAWAFAWRTLIAAELVFGVSSGSGGIGWFIFENRNNLEIANVFAGLTTVIIIGLLVESVIFRTLEEHTVRRWGMQK